MGRKSSTDQNSTLTPVTFQILLALSQGERHGYAIIQEIEERMDGAFPMGAGTLYRAIKQLLDADFITEVEPRRRTHSQRRYYRITQAGRRRAAAEARVFTGIAAWAREAISPSRQR